MERLSIIDQRVRDSLEIWGTSTKNNTTVLVEDRGFDGNCDFALMMSRERGPFDTFDVFNRFGIKYQKQYQEQYAVVLDAVLSWYESKK